MGTRVRQTSELIYESREVLRFAWGSEYHHKCAPYKAIIMSISLGISIGTSSVVARSIGAGEMEQVRQLLKTARSPYVQIKSADLNLTLRR